MRERLVIRLSNQYLLQFIGMLRELFGQDVVKGLIFISIVHANVGYLALSPSEPDRYAWLDTLPPESAGRPIRPHKVALSLGLPRETVRRKTAALIAEGYLTDTGDGLIAALATVARPEIDAVILRNTDLVTQLYHRLAEAGVAALPPLPTQSATQDIPHRAIIRLSLGYVLRCMDEVRQLFDGDILTGLIYCAIVDANTAYLNDLPQRPYAELSDQVPDEARRPISALALALHIGLPRETTRRHVAKLKARGQCVTVRGGLISPQSAFASPSLMGATLRNAANVRQFAAQLAAIGLAKPVGQAL